MQKHYKNLLIRECIQDQLFKIIRVIREVVFPRRCPICSDIVIPKGNTICRKCRNKPLYVSEPYCMKCGKPIQMDHKEYCYDCTKKEFHYTSGRALFIYDTVMRKSIALFKFHGKKEYADFYVEEMVRILGGYIKSISPDYFVPIPVHKNRLIKRGFNQAEIISDKLSKYFNIKNMPDLLIRQKNTLPQKELDNKERMKNLKTAFCINEKAFSKIIKDAKIMLVDDIYTTGSTIEVCSKILLSYGIKNVYFICICIGKGY